MRVTVVLARLRPFEDWARESWRNLGEPKVTRRIQGQHVKLQADEGGVGGPWWWIRVGERRDSVHALRGLTGVASLVTHETWEGQPEYGREIAQYVEIVEHGVTPELRAYWTLVHELLAHESNPGLDEVIRVIRKGPR